MEVYPPSSTSNQGMEEKSWSRSRGKGYVKETCISGLCLCSLLGSTTNSERTRGRYFVAETVACVTIPSLPQTHALSKVTFIYESLKALTPRRPVS